MSINGTFEINAFIAGFLSITLIASYVNYLG